LRFGCIEVGASWVPLVDHMYRRRLANRAARDRLERSPVGDVFATNRVYAACEVDEDIPMLLRYISEDNLIVGSDYGHNDPSQEHWFVTRLLDLAERDVLSKTVVRKVLWDNPQRFYGL
jgi:predicted TIM-barrel fold metal-dependent hydrolase